MLWTYADRRDDGHYDLIGGGAYDAATNTWSQGAFNADDVTRAADRPPAALAADRRRRPAGTKAFDLLRAVAYFQTATGDQRRQRRALDAAGRHPEPAAPCPEGAPDPSDSAESYWLARTVWALGEGYAAFRALGPGLRRASSRTGWT